MYHPKARKEYIACCRYYKGGDEENTLPNEDHLLAYYERYWVDAHYDENKLADLRILIKHYKEFGLAHFSQQDGAPIALKALIWSRFMHWGYNETPDTFKTWWNTMYLKKTSKQTSN